MRRLGLLAVAVLGPAASAQTTGALRFTREAATVQASGVSTALTVVNSFNSPALPATNGSGGTNGYTSLTAAGYTNAAGSQTPTGGTGIDARTGYGAAAPGFTVATADLYGGAGNTGNYLIVGPYTGAANTATITLSRTAYYFGLWLSALDPNNRVEFYRGNTLVDSVQSGRVLDGLPSAYFGNPNTGQNQPEAYVFLNIYSDDKSAAGGFDRVVLVNPGDSGLESDNHTFSFSTDVPVTLRNDEFLILPVPEPAGLLAVAAGLLALRRRRRERVR